MATVRYIIKSGSGFIAKMTDGTTTQLMKQPGHTWVGKGQTQPTNGTTTNNPPADANAANANGTGKVTAEMIGAAVTSAGGSTGNMVNTADEIAAAFNDAISKLAPGDFGSKARRACHVGECAQETDWYQTYSEYGGAGSSYAPYYGRGFIQLTWSDNYSAFADWLTSKGVTNNVMGDINSVATLPYAAYAAIFYFVHSSWNGHTLAEFCDSCGGPPDWGQISRAINRGNPYATSAAYGEDIRNKAINAVLAVTPDETKTSDAGTKAAAWGLTTVGRFFYTGDPSMRNNMMQTNAGDCSSFYVLCYTQGAGKTNEDLGGSGNYPGYTGTLAAKGAAVNDTGSETDGPMAVGDAVLFDWGGSSPTFDHVAMYIGGNQVLSHGGPEWNDKGPKVQTLSGNVSAASRVKVVRFS